MYEPRRKRENNKRPTWHRFNKVPRTAHSAHPPSRACGELEIFHPLSVFGLLVRRVTWHLVLQPVPKRSSSTSNFPSGLPDHTVSDMTSMRSEATGGGGSPSPEMSLLFSPFFSPSFEYNTLYMCVVARFFFVQGAPIQPITRIRQR
jgi:hypothetical protein